MKAAKSIQGWYNLIGERGKFVIAERIEQAANERDAKLFELIEAEAISNHAYCFDMMSNCGQCVWCKIRAELKQLRGEA